MRLCYFYYTCHLDIESSNSGHILNKKFMVRMKIKNKIQFSMIVERNKVVGPVSPAQYHRKNPRNHTIFNSIIASVIIKKKYRRNFGDVENFNIK